MARIDSVEVYILKAPLGKAKFWSSQSSFPERNSLLVRITSDGLSGWGEAGQYGPPEPVASAIKVKPLSSYWSSVLLTKVSLSGRAG